ncbi:MAG TPA: DUF2017 family protein, partial [Acidimicrobiia bacterium]
GESLVISLAPEELELIRGLRSELRPLLDGGAGDPAHARIFPRAYLDPTEESAEEQWQEMVHPGLLRARLDALDLVTSTLDRGIIRKERIEITLEPDEVQAWLGVLNDIRLVLGVRLEVTEELDEIGPSDPRAAGFAMYHWLTWLQGDLVEALLG